MTAEDATGVTLCHKNERKGQYNAKRVSFISLKYHIITGQTSSREHELHPGNITPGGHRKY